MEIKKLIEVYEKLLPIYKAHKTRPEHYDITMRGMCYAVYLIYNRKVWYEFSSLFRLAGYYHELNEFGDYLFRPSFLFRDITGIKKRIDFMESEIKDLKRLQKKGYTHV